MKLYVSEGTERKYILLVESLGESGVSARYIKN